MRILFEVGLFLVLVLALLYVATRLFPQYFRQEKDTQKTAGARKEDYDGKSDE